VYESNRNQPVKESAGFRKEPWFIIHLHSVNENGIMPGGLDAESGLNRRAGA
jgi:hypothetical protein